jgi:hypothetical protein
LRAPSSAVRCSHGFLFVPTLITYLNHPFGWFFILGGGVASWE